jgi:hypothetical protein
MKRYTYEQKPEKRFSLSAEDIHMKPASYRYVKKKLRDGARRELANASNSSNQQKENDDAATTCQTLLFHFDAKSLLTQ